MKEVLRGIYIRFRKCLNGEKLYGTVKYAVTRLTSGILNIQKIKMEIWRVSFLNLHHTNIT
jgi:hypothetical protein